MGGHLHASVVTSQGNLPVPFGK